MPLISRVPEFCKERGMGITDLHNAVVNAGETFSYNNAWQLFHGKIPGMPTVAKLCNTFKRQPFEFVLWEEGR